MRVALVVFLLSAVPAYAEPKPYRISTQLFGEKLRVMLQAEKPARINPEAPVSLTLKQTGSITFKKTDFSRSDAAGNESELRFEVQGTRSARVAPSVEGHLSFFLCTAKSCKKIEEDFTALQALDQEKRG